MASGEPQAHSSSRSVPSPAEHCVGQCSLPCADRVAAFPLAFPPSAVLFNRPLAQLTRADARAEQRSRRALTVVCTVQAVPPHFPVRATRQSHDCDEFAILTPQKAPSIPCSRVAAGPRRVVEFHSQKNVASRTSWTGLK